MLAGGYVGLGILLIFSVGGQQAAAESPAVKLAMGVSFGIALSLVIMAGSELFTGNVFVFGACLLRGSVKGREAAAALVSCWFGNLAGSVLTAWLSVMSGLATGPVGAVLFLVLPYHPISLDRTRAKPETEC